MLDWWSLRLIYLYQQLFEEKPESLATQSTDLIEKLKLLFNKDNHDSYLKKFDTDILKFATVCFNLEAGQVYYQNYNWNNGQECFQNALEMSHVKFELTGAYGKRTKFQQKDLAQLMLKVDKETNKTGSIISSKWDHFNKDLDVSQLSKVIFIVIIII